jgi:serpin B
MFHQAFVKVDEHGTEAAAATVSSFVALEAPAPPSVEFRADHPFLFLLRDASSGAILFMGRISDPRPMLASRASGVAGSTPGGSGKARSP